MEYLQYLKYNNYFNRIHKPKYNTATQYWTATNTPQAERKLYEQNFNSGDGVNTIHVLGKYDETSNYDYLVIYNNSNGTSINSRWFIKFAERIRGGQYRLTLKRDTITDFENDVLNAPAIIERAKVNWNNKLIYNKEQFTYNQIKVNEKLLKDKSQIPWIVGYISKTGQWTGDDRVNLQGDILNNPNIIKVVDKPLADGTYKNLSDILLYTRWINGSAITGGGYISRIGRQGSLSTIRGESTASLVHSFVNDVEIVTNELKELYNSIGWGSTIIPQANETLKNLDDSFLANGVASSIAGLSDQLVYVTNEAKLYKVKVTENPTPSQIYTQLLDSGSLYTTLKTAIDGSSIFGSTTVNVTSLYFTYNYYNISIEWEEQTNASGYIEIHNTRAKGTEGIYDMFCIPYGTMDVYESVNNTKLFTMKEELERDASISIGTKLTENACFDIQILPYCPIQNIIEIRNGVPTINVTPLNATKEFEYIKDSSNNNIGVIYYVKEAQVPRFNIDEQLNVELDELFNVKYPDYSTTSFESGKSYEIWNNGSDIVVTDWWGNYFSGNDSFSMIAPLNSIKIDKVDLSTNLIIKTFYSDVVGFEMEYVDDTHIRITAINLVDDYVSMDDYNDSNYRYVITPTSTFEFDAEEPDVVPYVEDLLCKILPIATTTTINEADGYKIDSETDFVRICSPNYQGAFDFCVAKNGGVTKFNVDMTLRPINPYIHVCPEFNPDFMYGNEYKDARGLICNGDFSFGRVTSAWDTYQLQNKNYEAIFNRQIQNMDVEHRLQKTEAVVGAIAGTIQGAATGGTAGSMVGLGPAGAIAGGVASGLGGLADISILNQRQGEQKDYAIDMHEFQLGNIKALPYSLTKCPAFTNNNKYFPFLEFYSATSEEREALKKYLSLRSYNIGVIGTIDEYRQYELTFIKGQIIRLDSLHCPSNIANDIYEEIDKGVYI